MIKKHLKKGGTSHKGFRLPDDLISLIEKSAVDNQRNFTNEVVYRLLESFKKESVK